MEGYLLARLVAEGAAKEWHASHELRAAAASAGDGGATIPETLDDAPDGRARPTDRLSK